MSIKRNVAVIFTLLALSFAVPFFLPTGSYIKKIEQAASNKIGAPVKIGSLHFALLPSPRVNIADLAIGSHEEILVRDIAAVLDVTTLLDDVRVISTLHIEQPQLKQTALALIGSIAVQKEASSNAAPVEVQRIVLNKAKIEMNGTPLPDFDAEIALAAGGKLQHMSLISSDGTLNVAITPTGSGYAAAIKATNWQLPLGPQLRFDTLTADIVYAGTTVKFPHIDAKLYRGKLSATGQLDWRSDWRLSGTFTSEGIELGDASALFTKTVKITGRISGDGKFTGIAREAGELADTLAVDYKFKVANGVLHGVDLVNAANLLVRQGQRGGETRFDAFSGTLHTRGKNIEVQSLHIASGLLEANGKVKIGADKSLAGKINAEIKKGVALVTVPLQLSGTMDDPVVLPTKAALAGAAAGTALMGPLGTDLGIKAGSALDKLFGGAE